MLHAVLLLDSTVPDHLGVREHPRCIMCRCSFLVGSRQSAVGIWPHYMGYSASKGFVYPCSPESTAALSLLLTSHLSASLYPLRSALLTVNLLPVHSSSSC